jgi:hypothetical protein
VAQPINGELGGTGVVEVPMTAARGGFTGGLYAPALSPVFVYIIGGVSAYTGVTGSFVNQPTTATPTLVNTVQYLYYPFAAPQVWVTATGNPVYPVSIAYGASVVSTAFSSPRIYYFGGTQALGASASGQASGFWIPTPPIPGTTWSDTWTSINTTNMSARWGQGAVSLNN